MTEINLETSIPLLSELSGPNLLSEKLWTELFSDDSLRLLRIDDPATLHIIRLTITSSSGNFTTLLGEASSALCKVVAQYERSSEGEAVWVFVDDHASTNQIIPRACAAVHLSMLCCHYCAADKDGTMDASQAQAVESLMECALDLISHSTIVEDQLYDLLLETVHLLLVGLSITQLQEASGQLSSHVMSSSGSDGGNIEASILQKRKQADGAVEALLAWFVHRPKVPSSLLSNPSTTAAAVDTQSMLDHATQLNSTAAPLSLVSGAPMTLVHLQHTWLLGLTRSARMVLSLPLAPIMKVYSYVFTGRRPAVEADADNPHTGQHIGLHVTDTLTEKDFSSSDRTHANTSHKDTANTVTEEKWATRQSANILKQASSTLASPLSDRGVLLLLLLIHRGRDFELFRTALQQIRDPRFLSFYEGDAELALSSHGSVSFEAVTEALSGVLARHSEAGTLLLYSMLQGNVVFRDTLLARSDLDTLIIPLLERMYQPDRARSPASLYVMVIILLTFTEDSGYNATSFQHLFIPKVAWYQERYMRNVSLGSLTMLCVLRVVIYNLNHLNDLYLLENSLAILWNLSPHIESLHPYASQRMIAVTVTVMTKFGIYWERNNQSAESDVSSEKQGAKSQLLVLGRCAEVMLRVVNVSLRPKLMHKNANIIYVILHKQQELLHAASHPSLVPHVGVLTSLIEFMNKRLELTVSGDLSVEKTMEVIERGISAFIARDPPETVKAAEQSAISVPEKMRYEEQPESEDFFRPYTWEVIYVHTVRDLHWLPTTQVLNSSSSQPTS